MNFFGLKAGIKLGVLANWQCQDRTEKNTGSSEYINALLQTSTTCYYQAFDLYWDAVFASYAFVPSGTGYHNACTETAPVSGRVLDANGRPMQNVSVVATLPSGIRRTVLTNAQGRYRIFDVRVGKVTAVPQVAAGGVISHVVEANNAPVYAPPQRERRRYQRRNEEADSDADPGSAGELRPVRPRGCLVVVAAICPALGCSSTTVTDSPTARWASTRLPHVPKRNPPRVPLAILRPVSGRPTIRAASE